MFTSADALFEVAQAIQAERIRKAQRRWNRPVKVEENGVSRKLAS